MALRRAWRRGWVALLGLSLGGLMPVASARDVAGLYRVELPAVDQSRASRERLTREGLRELVQRLTGQRPQAQEGNPALDELLAEAPALVQSFGFRAPSIEERDASGAQFVLQLDFEPVAVHKRLGQAGLALWGAERPETLLWLVMPAALPQPPATTSGAEASGDAPAAMPTETIAHPGFLNPGEAPLLETHLAQAARRRGLPFSLPKDEPAERETLSLEALRMPVPEAIEAASVSYGADTLLAAELQPAGTGWSGRGHLLAGGELESWEFTAASTEAALTALLDGLGERLARRYALRQDAESGILRLRISNVRSLADYAALMRYLASLSVVKRAGVRAVQGHELEVELTTGADAAALRQTLALGRHLQAVTGTQDGLNYQWQP